MDSQTVKAFYDRFPYPPAPDSYARLLDDPWLFAKAIGQETGRRAWRPKRIWVAGCGAMQALNTALAFPAAEVLGTDISEDQLERCWADERQVGAPNLTLAQFDLSKDAWDRKFDYIICTGVIHHMPDPRVGLLQLRSALATDGLLELMVYHTYHVARYAAFADGVRTLLGTRNAPDFEREWELVRGLTGDGGVPDTLIHPIIHHYTMRSFARLVQLGALRFVQPRFNHESKGAPYCIVQGVVEEWERLSDLDRWIVSSELQYERSPMLWFYLEHECSPWAQKTVRQLDEEFATAEKRPFKARLQPYVRQGAVLVRGEPIAFPPPPPDSYTTRPLLTTQANAYLEVL